jgi:tetratricopeptide (TPR) repeat protein
MSDPQSQSHTEISGGQGVQNGTGNTQYNYYGVTPPLPGADPTSLSEPRRLWNVPHPRNPFFTGREEILTELERMLATTQKGALTQEHGVKSQAISGLGGVGKTQTAVEYAYRHREQYCAVFWAQADTEATLDTYFRGIAVLLDLPEKDAQDSSQVREAVKRWLAHESDYLFILDNADDLSYLKAYLPLNPAGHLLLTSRANHFGEINLHRPTLLPVWGQDEAIDFLLQRTGRLDADDSERTAASDLAREMGYLPLGLEQAGAYMCAKQASFQSYIKSYRTRRLLLLQNAKPETGAYEKTVATTWSLNFEAVERESEGAAELLRVSAFFNPDRIPEELIISGASAIGEHVAEILTDYSEEPVLLDALLEHLSRYSLILRDSKTHTYDIHRLVQTVIQHHMDEQTRRECAERALGVIYIAFPATPEYTDWDLCERLLPHAFIGAENIDAYQFGFIEAGRVLQYMGYYLDQRAQYSVAEPILRRALTIHEQTLGVSHSDTYVSLNNLAMLLFKLGRYETAEPLLVRTLNNRLESFGEKHLDTAFSINNIAGLYDKQGRHEEAEALYLRALKIRQELLGFDHPGTANSINNLGTLYFKMGRYREAEPLFVHALAINEQSLGTNHPVTSTTINNLAMLYVTLEHFVEAEPLLERALDISEKSLGCNHPETATSFHSLGVLYFRQGRYSEAEPLVRRALGVWEEFLGVNHPDTIGAREDLFCILENINV